MNGELCTLLSFYDFKFYKFERTLFAMENDTGLPSLNFPYHHYCFSSSMRFSLSVFGSPRIPLLCIKLLWLSHIDFEPSVNFPCYHHSS